MLFDHRVGIAVLCAALSSAASASERHSLVIPAGKLGRAAAVLGRQARVSIGISDSRVANLHVRRVAGVMTVNEALARMLRDVPARFVAVDRSTFLIIGVRPAAPSAQRPRKRSQRQQSGEPASRQPTPEASGETDASPAEIVITASKRGSRLEDYPASITVVAGDQLVTGRGLAGSDALVAKLPIVTSTYLGPGRNKLFLRGIADSSFNGPTQTTVAQYFDEARLNFTAPDPDLRLYDIQRIELLPGPQASLYGAGSLGGVIRVVSNPPDLEQVGGNLSIGASATAHGGPGDDLAGALNIPLLPGTAALRFVGYRSDEGGYIDDVRRKLSNINGVHILGGRASARAEVQDWTVDFRGLAQRIRGDDAQFSNRPSDPLTTENSVRQNYSNDFALASVTVRREQPLLIVLTGAVSRQSLRERYDASTFEQTMLFLERTKAGVASLEARVSHEATRHSGWLAGISAVQNDYDQTRALSSPDVLDLALPGVHNRQTEVAAFGELTHPLFGGIDATAGVRLARSEVRGGVLNSRRDTTTERRKQDFFLPSIALSGRPAPALLLYVRYQQGFRAGGFSIFGDRVEVYRPDRMSAIEVGGRYGGDDDRRPRIEASLTHTRWRDVQADTLDVRGFPTTVTAGDGRLYTASVQLSWKLSSLLEIETAAVFNHSVVTNPTPFFNPMVRPPLPNVAKLNARAAARFTTSLPSSRNLSVLASMHYVGKSQLGAGPMLGREQGGWLEGDADATLSFGTQRLSLSITNLFGIVGNRFAFGSPFTIGQVPQITPLRPRTVRIAWDLDF